MNRRTVLVNMQNMTVCKGNQIPIWVILHIHSIKAHQLANTNSSIHGLHMPKGLFSIEKVSFQLPPVLLPMRMLSTFQEHALGLHDEKPVETGHRDACLLPYDPCIVNIDMNLLRRPCKKL